LASPFCSSSRISYIKFPSGRDVHDTNPKGKKKIMKKNPLGENVYQGNSRIRKMDRWNTGRRQQYSSSKSNKIGGRKKNETFPQNINICKKETTVPSKRIHPT
jgi:hypothetical protein